MKGRTISEIAKELHHIKENSVDLIAHPGNLEMTSSSTLVIHGSKKPMTVEPTRHAHGQLGTFLDIPKAYYDRMLTEQPGLLKDNVNTWLKSQAPDNRRMLRTTSGKLRAFLSNAYARRDSYDLMNVLYPIIQNNKMQVVSAELTETRLYIKATHPNMKGLVKRGDEVIGGVVISTSDVGAGSLRVEPYSVRLLCTNGMVSETALRQRHVGKRQGEESLMEILSDEAIEADDNAFFLKARDVLINAIKPDSFQRLVDRYTEASERLIKTPNLTHVVELAAKRVGLHHKWMKEDIVKQLLTGNEGAGLTQWGLANSFTALAKGEKVDYDTAVELERAGGAIVNLNDSDWKALAGA